MIVAKIVTHLNPMAAIILLAVAFGIALLYLSIIALIVRSSLYPIRIQQFISPGYMGFPQRKFEAHAADGVHLDGWICGDGEDLAIICAHGYLVNRCEWVPDCQFLIPKGATMVFFDLRSHGRSGRAKVTFGRDEAMDVQAAIRETRRLRPNAKIVLLGSSMGATASIIAASREPVDALILDAPFWNLREASDAWWTFLAGPKVARLMRPASWIGPLFLGFNPATLQVGEFAARVRVPVLLFFGTEDPIVPVESARKLTDAFGGPTQMIWFEGCTHGAGRYNHPDLYRNAISAFLADASLVEQKS